MLLKDEEKKNASGKQVEARKRASGYARGKGEGSVITHNNQPLLSGFNYFLLSSPSPSFCSFYFSVCLVFLRKYYFRSLLTHHFQQLNFFLPMCPPVNFLSSLNSHTYLSFCFSCSLKLITLNRHRSDICTISSMRLYLFKISDHILYVHIFRDVYQIALYKVYILKRLELINLTQ